MSRVADYLVIADSKLSVSRTKEGGFSQPFEFVLEDAAHLPSRSILMFVLFVLDGTKNLKLDVKINGSSQLSYTLTFSGPGARVHSLHEVIDAQVLKHGNNTIHFHPVSGEGQLEFGDVVLFYQRDI